MTELSSHQDAGTLATLGQTRSSAETHSQNLDPKFQVNQWDIEIFLFEDLHLASWTLFFLCPFIQNSKSFQFVSKMSRGDLILEDNQMKPNGNGWADELQHTNINEKWETEFTAGEVVLDIQQKWLNIYKWEPTKIINISKWDPTKIINEYISSLSK